MKRLVVICLLLLFITSCSIEKRRYRKGFHLDRTTSPKQENVGVITDVQVGIACYRIFHDPHTRSYFEDHYAGDFNLKLFRQNLFFAAAFRPMTLRPRQNFLFDGQELTSFAKINHNRSDLVVGYMYSLYDDLHFEPYIGQLHTGFRVINESEIGAKYGVHRTRGVTLGFSLNKTFEIENNMAIVLSVNNNLNFSNYKRINPNFGNYFYGVSFGIAFRQGVK